MRYLFAKTAVFLYLICFAYTAYGEEIETYDHIIQSAKIGFLETPKGHRVRYAHWQSKEPSDKPAIVIFPGRASFIEKHTEFTKDMLEKGHEVFIIDWLGQGGSSRLLPNLHKGHVEKYEDYIQNARQFMEEVVFLETSKPVVIFGSSMGAHITLRYLMETKNPNAAKKLEQIQGAVLESPMLDIPTKPFPRWFAEIFVRVGSWAGFAGAYAPGYGDYNPDHYVFDDKKSNTNDRKRFERQKKYTIKYDRYVNGGPTIGWVKATFDSIKVIQNPKKLRKIKTPILMVDAGKDDYVLNKGDVIACTHLPKCRIIFYPDSKHHIAVEVDPIRNRFFADIDSFIESTGNQKG